MHLQSEQNKVGEIRFRQKLVQQQVDGNQIFDDEFTGESIIDILKSRIDTTAGDLQGLISRGVRLSPYLEIGAERTQRSMVLETDFTAQGAALDISFEMLQSGNYYQNVFNKILPQLVCADLYQIPYRSNSIPFVFGYQILHHFPHPEPIVREVSRVLAPGGCFFVSEEPFKQQLKLKLYKTGKVFSQKHRSRSLVRKVLDRLFAEYINNETEHGVIENDEITIATWKRTFNIFDRCDVTLKSPGGITSSIKHVNPLNYLLGGDLTALCFKKGKLKESYEDIEDMIVCPDCLKKGIEAGVTKHSDRYVCDECKSTLPIRNNIKMLLPFSTGKRLYPDKYRD